MNNSRVLYRLIFIYVSIALILGAIKTLYFLNKSLSWSSQTFWNNFAQIQLANFIVIAFLTFVALLTTQILKENIQPNSTKSVWLFFGISLVGGVLSYIISGFFLELLFPATSSLINEEMTAHLDRLMATVDVTFLFYVALLFMIYSHHANSKTLSIAAMQAETQKELLNYKLKHIKSRMEPHFLYNSLNTISSMVSLDGKKANHLISQVADFLRLTISHTDKEWVTISEEVNYLENYLSILKARFEDKLTYQFEVANNIKSYSIPTGLIQPLIENAVKHGMKNNSKPLRILISFSTSNSMIIEVFNSGSPLEKELPKLELGSGLQLIHEKLNLMYEADYDFKLENHQAENFKVKAQLVLPITHSSKNLQD